MGPRVAALFSAFAIGVQAEFPRFQTELGEGIKLTLMNNRQQEDAMRVDDVQYDRVRNVVYLTGDLAREVSHGDVAMKVNMGEPPADYSAFQRLKQKAAFHYAVGKKARMTREPLCGLIGEMRCPLKAGKQTLNLAFQQLPKMVMTGEYFFEAKISDANGKPVTSIKAHLKVPRRSPTEFQRLLEEGMAPAPSSSCSGRMDDEGYCQICDQGDLMADNMIDDDGKQTRCGDMQSWMTMPDDTKENGQHDHGKCQGLQHHFAKSCCTENCAESSMPIAPSSCSGRMNDEGYCQICDHANVMQDNMIHEDGKDMRCGDIEWWMNNPDDKGENAQHDHEGCQGLQRHYGKACCDHYCGDGSHMVGSARGQGVMLAAPLLALAAAAGF